MSLKVTNQSPYALFTPVIPTKLQIPALDKNHLFRPRLSAPLQAQKPKLTIVSAPAGYGKTALVREWLNDDISRTVWISADEHDQDLVRFWRYVFTAYKALPEPLYVVIDHYHLLQEPATQQTFIDFYRKLPAHMRLFVISRYFPDELVASWPVEEKLHTVRAQDLRFTLQEIQSLFKQALQVERSVDQLIHLEERTEGWIAALKFYLYLVQEGAKLTHVSRHLSGEHHHLTDYFLEEVWDRETAEVQTFWLQTSILRHMNASLCQSLTEGDKGEKILQYLKKQQLFITPLPSETTEQSEYRYHPLFRQFLVHRLQTNAGEHWSKLHQNASAAYQQQEKMLEAVHHAIQGDDPIRAIFLMETQLQNTAYISRGLLALNGRIKQAYDFHHRLTEHLPGKQKMGQHHFMHTGHRRLALADILYEWNETDQALHYLQPVLDIFDKESQQGKTKSPQKPSESTLSVNDSLFVPAMILLSRIEWVGNHFQKAFATLERTKRKLQQSGVPQTSQWFSFLVAQETRFYVSQGKIKQAWQTLEPCVRLRQLELKHEFVYMTYVRILIRQKQWKKALNLLQRLLHIAEKEGRLGTKIEIFILQAIIWYEQNDRPQSQWAVGKAIHLAQQEGYVRIFMDEDEMIAQLLDERQSTSRQASESVAYVHHLLQNFKLRQPATMPPPMIRSLTPREREVFGLLEQGYSNKKIAEKLNISLSTVKGHIFRIYTKLGVKNRAQAVAKVRKNHQKTEL